MSNKEKYTIENLTAYNGSEILIVKSRDYTHTQYDDIVADWRENFSNNVWVDENKEKSLLTLRHNLEWLKDLAEDLLIRFICWVLFEPESETQRREKYCGTF